MPGATTLDRIIIGAVAVLLAAFTLGSLGPLVTSASGDDVSGKRDDDVRELVAIEDDDEGDGDDGRYLARDDNSRSAAGSNSGSRSIGSNSGNTRTGTTRGTGVSRTVSNSSGQSRVTKTGTTRNTGPSRSVSNSS